MYTVWHVDKYKITFKLVINWTKGLSRPGIIDARARYRAVAWKLRNTALTNRLMTFLSLHNITAVYLEGKNLITYILLPQKFN